MGLYSLKVSVPDGLVYPMGPWEGKAQNPLVWASPQIVLGSTSESYQVCCGLQGARQTSSLLPDPESYFPPANSLPAPPPCPFCICSFLSPGHSSLDIQMVDSLHFRSLLKYQLLGINRPLKYCSPWGGHLGGSVG